MIAPFQLFGISGRLCIRLVLWMSFFPGVLSAQDIAQVLDGWFAVCENHSAGLEIVENDTFSISYPEYWNVDNELEAGIDISCKSFEDSIYRTVLLTVVPLDKFGPFAKPNPLVSYYRVIHGKFQGHDAILFTRNDLKNDGKGLGLWRNELKILDPENNLLYILVFGKMAPVVQEPEWCEFEMILRSYRIKS